jgi:pimeloyl-ACP methyl ester carboxylesterase
MATRIGSFQSDQWCLSACVHVPDDVPEQRIGIVFVHENTKFGTHGLFRQVADAFASCGFYALRYDNRGTCDSPGDCELTFDERVTDACAATHFFRTEYNLDKVLFWGLCLGSAVAVHASARLSGPFRPAGMILCSLLTDPVEASLPEFNYRQVTLSAYLRHGLTGSNWNRLRAFVSDRGYRTNLLVSVLGIVRSCFRGNDRLQKLRSQISRVGPLLAQYDGPSLLIYGDTDSFWSSFTKRINPGDKLRLSEMKSPPQIAVVADGDHMFHSVQQTSEVIRLSVSWAAAFRDGQDLAAHPEEIHAVFASPTAV